jgi:hypothetical protein
MFKHSYYLIFISLRISIYKDHQVVFMNVYVVTELSKWIHILIYW